MIFILQGLLLLQKACKFKAVLLVMNASIRIVAAQLENERKVKIIINTG